MEDKVMLKKRAVLRRKSIFVILLVVLAVGFNSQSHAQNSRGQHTFTYNWGSSLATGVIKTLFKDRTLTDSSGRSLSFEVRSSPVLVFGYDYNVSDKFSLGVIYSKQSISGNTDWAFTNDKGIYKEENIKFRLRRTNISVCPRFHYLTDGRLDLYSGLRVGMIFWTTKIESGELVYNELDRFAKLARPSGSLTLLGGRFMLLPNVGVHAELNLGAPNLVGAGFSVVL